MGEDLRPLTVQQRRVLGRLASGHTTKEIAALLGISDNAVKKHLENLRRRYGVSNRVELLIAAVDAGEVQLARRARAPEVAT